MARTSGVIGYGVQQKTAPGVWEDVIVERKFRGDVLRNSVGFEDAQKVNDNLTVGNTISVVASAYHRDHITDIRYITWLGKRWTVSNVDVQLPRLNMRLGGLYNGPTG